MDRLAQVFDFAGAWRNQPGNCPEQRTLAGSVAAHERNELAFTDGEIDAAQDHCCTVAGGKAANLENRRH